MYAEIMSAVLLKIAGIALMIAKANVQAKKIARLHGNAETGQNALMIGERENASHGITAIGISPWKWKSAGMRRANQLLLLILPAIRLKNGIGDWKNRQANFLQKN